MIKGGRERTEGNGCIGRIKLFGVRGQDYITVERWYEFLLSKGAQLKNIK